MKSRLTLLAQWTEERRKQLELTEEHKKRLCKRDWETFRIPAASGNRQHDPSETTCILDAIGLGLYSVGDFCYHVVHSSASISMKLIRFYCRLLVVRHVVWVGN
jgi:hypothetical protein